MSDDGKVLKLAKLTVLSVISAGCAINFAVVAQISYGREWQRLPDGTLVEVPNGEEGDIQWFTIVIALAGVFSLLFYAYAIMEMYKHPEKMDTTHPFQRKLNIAILCCAAPLAALATTWVILDGGYDGVPGAGPKPANLLAMITNIFTVIDKTVYMIVGKPIDVLLCGDKSDKSPASMKTGPSLDA